MASDEPHRNRPLSPHLQVYRWGWTMSLSILHRFTGVTLSMGLVLLLGWLAALAAGPAAFATAQAIAAHWFGKIVLAAWSFAFFYHLCNGIRHLLWDLGHGFELDVARRTGLTVVLASVILSVASWLFAGGFLGGNA